MLLASSQASGKVLDFYQVQNLSPKVNELAESESRGKGCRILSGFLKSNYGVQEGEDEEQRGRIRPLLQSQIIKKITLSC